MTIRSLATHLFAGAFLALALALGSLAFAGGHSTAYARPLRTTTSLMGRATVDGLPAPPDSCAIGDSWCAFCTANPGPEACKAFPPAKASGTSASAPPGRSGNNPIPGVTTGGVTPGSIVSGTTVGPISSLPATGYWLACRAPYGATTVWVLNGLPLPVGVTC